MSKVRLKYALFVAAFIVAVLWIVKLWEVSLHQQFYIYGVYPRRLYGLRGVLLAPFIHGDFKHLYSNSVPLFVLTAGLFYFYPHRAWKVFIISWLATYFMVWLIGRPAYHIGISGLVYALTSFHVFAGIFSGKRGMLAVSLLVIFLYGSAIWGMLPDFAFDKSWEAHASGYFIGFILALGEIKKDPDQNNEYRFLNFRSEPDAKIDFDYEYKENS